MAKKKEEKQEVNKKQEKKKEAPKEKYPVFQLVEESNMDTGIVVGALNSKGLYLQFIDDLKSNQQTLKLSKEEFDKMIKEYRYGEL